MRLAFLVGVSFVLAAIGSAQHRGGFVRGGSGPGVSRGFGGGSPGVSRGFVGGGFRGPTFVQPRVGFGFSRPGFVSGFRPIRSFGFGYGGPVFYGGYGYGGSGYSSFGYYDPYYYAPPVTVISAPYEAPPSTVIYNPPSPPREPARDPGFASRDTLYLIAFTDGSIQAAVAYWVDQDTLHYVTRAHEQRTAPLARLDRPMSERLNRERGVPFRLPE